MCHAVWSSEMFESVENLSWWHTVTGIRGLLVQLLAPFGTRHSRRQAARAPCHWGDLPGTGANRGQLISTHSLTDRLWVFPQPLLPNNKLLSKKTNRSSLKKLGLYLQHASSDINNLISSANNKVLHNLIKVFFSINTWKVYAKQIVCGIFFAHPQQRILNIWKHRKDCQSLKSSCFHSSFKLQINS